MRLEHMQVPIGMVSGNRAEPAFMTAQIKDGQTAILILAEPISGETSFAINFHFVVVHSEARGGRPQHHFVETTGRYPGQHSGYDIFLRRHIPPPRQSYPTLFLPSLPLKRRANLVVATDP